MTRGGSGCSTSARRGRSPLHLHERRGVAARRLRAGRARKARDGRVERLVAVEQERGVAVLNPRVGHHARGRLELVAQPGDRRRRLDRGHPGVRAPGEDRGGAVGLARRRCVVAARGRDARPERRHIVGAKELGGRTGRRRLVQRLAVAHAVGQPRHRSIEHGRAVLFVTADLIAERVRPCLPRRVRAGRRTVGRRSRGRVLRAALGPPGRRTAVRRIRGALRRARVCRGRRGAVIPRAAAGVIRAVHRGRTAGGGGRAARTCNAAPHERGDRAERTAHADVGSDQGIPGIRKPPSGSGGTGNPVGRGGSGNPLGNGGTVNPPSGNCGRGNPVGTGGIGNRKPPSGMANGGSGKPEGSGGNGNPLGIGGIGNRKPPSGTGNGGNGKPEGSGGGVGNPLGRGGSGGRVNPPSGNPGNGKPGGPDACSCCASVDSGPEPPHPSATGASGNVMPASKTTSFIPKASSYAV